MPQTPLEEHGAIAGDMDLIFNISSMKITVFFFSVDVVSPLMGFDWHFSSQRKLVVSRVYTTSVT